MGGFKTWRWKSLQAKRRANEKAEWSQGDGRGCRVWAPTGLAALHAAAPGTPEMGRLCSSGATVTNYGREIDNLLNIAYSPTHQGWAGAGGDGGIHTYYHDIFMWHTALPVEWGCGCDMVGSSMAPSSAVQNIPNVVS